MMAFNRRRSDILAEIVATEETYVKALSSIKRKFMAPLARIVNQVQVNTVFPGCNDLWKFHTRFLSQLHSLMQKQTAGNRTEVALLFVDLASDIPAVYSPFLNAAENAAQMLEKLMQTNPRVCEFVQSVQSDNGWISGTRYLGELIVTPMQRLPRYQLLLQELLKVTSYVFPDWMPLTQALDRIRKANVTVNESKRTADEQKRRLFFEQHASMSVLRPHKFEERSVHRLRFCGECTKNLWTMSKKAFKCMSCKEYFHPKCKAALETKRVCMQRRRIDLSRKRLITTHDVYLLPKDAKHAQHNKLQHAQSKSSSLDLLKHPRHKRLGSPTQSSSSSSPSLTSGGGAKRASECHNQVRGMLCFFEDGLGFANMWVVNDNNNDGDSHIDLLGQVPWSAVETVRVLDQDPVSGLHPFVIPSTGGAVSWTFALRTPLECKQMVRLLNETKEKAIAEKALHKSEKYEGKMNLLMKSGAIESISSSEKQHK